MANVEKTIWDYLMSKLGNACGVAGIMGNIKAESNMRSTNMQDSYERKVGYDDETYTAAVDNGTYTNFINDKIGYGIVQWTYYSLKRDLLNYAKSKKTSIGDLDMQLEFLCNELQSEFPNVWNVCKNAKSVAAASNYMLLNFERPSNMGEAVQKLRASYGQTFYDKYAPKTITLPAVPFTVKVLVSDLNYRAEGSMNGKVLGQTGKGTFTIIETNAAKWGKLKSGAGWIYLGNEEYCSIGNTIATTALPYTVRVTDSNLNIRSGAGTNYSVVGVITDKGSYTITAESEGKGATMWGKLKSGAGWISLDYCEKVS